MTRLFVLPHAGGSAQAYAPLKRALDGRIEVVVHELPAHGRRAGEAPVTTMDAALGDLIAHLTVPAGEPFAIFGHSMGALLGHAFIHTLLRQGRALPQVLFASGTPAPAARRRTAVAHLPKEAFWREVRAYGGMPDEILRVPDFRDFYETVIRADFAVIESGPAPAPRAVPVPVVAFYGTGEMSEGEAATWQRETTRPFTSHGYPGGHFFLFDHAEAVAAEILRVLGGTAERAEPRHA